MRPLCVAGERSRKDDLSEKLLMGLKLKRESPSGASWGGGMCVCVGGELMCSVIDNGSIISLLGLFDLFDLAGLVHHFPVDHGLSDHLDDLPGANIGLFCREEKQEVSQESEGDAEKFYFC